MLPLDTGRSSVPMLLIMGSQVLLSRRPLDVDDQFIVVPYDFSLVLVQKLDLLL
jgi:hypothetical protein